MRKFTYLMLLAAMLCLPQMVLADTDEVVDLTGKTGEVLHNQWTEMVYEYEPYIQSGSQYVQIVKEDLGTIAGFSSYKITDFQCIKEGTAVIKAKNANFDEYGILLGYTNYTFNVTVSADPYVSPTYISDPDPWAGEYDWNYTPDPTALHNISVEEGSTTDNWIKLMMIGLSTYDDIEHKFMRQWSEIPTKNISIVSDNTSAVVVSGSQFIAQNGAGGQSATITISCAPDATNDWVPSASFEFIINVQAPYSPTPSGQSFTWSERQINLVDLSCYNDGGKEQENGLINNIITSLTQTRDKNEDYSDPSTVESCQFNYGRIEISGCGDLKFKSIAGDLTGIIITGDIWTATNLPANWTYDDVAGTLTWVGTAAEEVTLSGNLSIEVSSIEYFYSPAAAPRLGDEFYDSYQWYEITGAHTAKAIRPRNLSGTVDIPASVEDNSVIYYINEIAENAFRNYNQLSNAFIGKNVAVIGAHAFDGCSQITVITIDSRVVESIGDEAFKNCLLLHGIECYTSLPPVLGSNAFEGDTRLNHIDVYSWVVSNYQGTANWSNYSSKITALWSARAIGEKFFYHNQKTTGVYEITSVSPKEVKVLPYPAEVNSIYPITYESSLIIPESPSYMHYGYKVTGIAANAFQGITDFKVVSIPTTVKSIEAGAFLGCTNVENVFFLWDDPTTVTWADGDDGLEFATAASGTTKIFVPEGKLEEYKAWAPKWAGCMYESAFEDVTASDDPHDVVYYRTYYDSSHDLMLPPDVWAYVGYVSGSEFILRPIAFDGEIVPAGTAVVLRSFSQTYRLIMMAPAAPAYTGTNELRGTDTQIVIASDPVLSAKAGQIYVLGREGWVNSQRQEGMGLYRYTGTTLGAHKAYLIYGGAPAGAPARFLFRPVKDTPMGVENVQENNAQCAKILRNGQLIIIKDGKEYNAQGIIIK